MSEFADVVAFLEKHGYRITEGYGRDEDPAHFGGHTLRRLEEWYDQERAAPTGDSERS